MSGPEPLLVELDLEDYAGCADQDELAALGDVAGPVLDIGCGPGRLVRALTERGVPALGIDVAPRALHLAAARDAPALAYSVFDRVPGEGRWPCVLLFDGNIGIGGDPVDLLARVVELMAPTGVAIVEVEAPGTPSQRSVARMDLGTGVTGWLPWARVGLDDVAAIASRVTLEVERVDRKGDRWFAWLRCGR